MRLVSEGVNEMEERGFKVRPEVAREAVAYVFGATEAVGSPDKIIYNSAKAKHVTNRVEAILKKGRVKKNPAARSGKWKIQIASVNGWADLKASIDGGPYVPDLYDSKAEAQREVDDIVNSGFDNTGSGSDYSEYRVVPASTRANDDLYNPLVRRKGESERDFMARCMSQEKESFPKQKQRVAVCLSKSRRNPYYDRNLDS